VPGMYSAKWQVVLVAAIADTIAELEVPSACFCPL